MNSNFNFELVNGFKGTMNNVNEVAQLVKAELLNTNNVVVVNDFRFSIGGAEGAEGYALHVETTDGNPNPFDRKCYVHKIYHLGKIRRGIDKYVADFLTLNAEYGMYNTPMFVWEDGKMVEYVDNNMVDMVNSADMTGIDENDTPCLDDIERVVIVIKDYIDNYEGMLMDYDGNSASICVPWDVFDEDDMKMLIEDGVFEACVVGVLMGRDIKDVLVYDDGVYVSVDAKMFDNVA